MTPFQFTSLLVCLAALFGYINIRTIRLPATIGLLVGAVIVSLAVIGLDRAFPGLAIRRVAAGLVVSANLPATFLDSALSFLLFAGALHVDLGALWDRKLMVLALSTASVVIAVAVIGPLMHLVFSGLGLPVPLIWCLLFGAVIAPTDPVAVLEVLERVGLPRWLQATIGGESLFNDGVAVVVFGLLLAIAMGDTGSLNAAEVAGMFLFEAVGGGLLGFATGYLAFLAMRSIDKYDVELILSIGLVMGTYSIAQFLHVSGPIAVVVAGLLTGSWSTAHAMSETTRHNVVLFWTIVDDVLNALLFMLIGFQLVVMNINRPALIAAAIAVPLALAARAISVALPTLLIDLRLSGKPGTVVALTWSGLRGGVSVALALTLPDIAPRGPVLLACYAVVLFTVIVQGLTLEKVVNLLHLRPDPGEA